MNIKLIPFNRVWKPILFTILNLLFIYIILTSLMIYTSLWKKMPWFEPCGMQFLHIIIFDAPVLLIIGIVISIFSKIDERQLFLPGVEDLIVANHSSIS